MENQNEEHKQLITRVLSGEGTREDEAALKLWLASDENNQTFYEQFKAVWQLKPFSTEKVTIDKPNAWDQIQRKIILEEEKVAVSTSQLNPQRTLYPFITALAAMVILAIGLFHFMKTSPEPIFQSVQAEKGLNENLQMADGSMVHLKGPSTLEFPEAFTGDKRKVRLTGEAFFEVIHQPDKPFIVEIPGANIIVLGTNFYLSSGADNNIVEVAVLSGKVMLESGDPAHGKILLTNNQRASYHRESGIIEHSEFTDLNFLAWHNGLITFTETPLQQVFRVLESTYGIEVKVHTDINNLKLTARFANEDAADIMQTIGIIFGLNIDHQQNKFIIK